MSAGALNTSMEKIVDFVQSLFSPKALLGFIVGTAIGFITTLVISFTPGYSIHIGEFCAAILVSLYFWLYCIQVQIKLTKSMKVLIAFALVFLLSIDSFWIVRQPVLRFIGGGAEKNYPPFDSLSYMISYGITCVFVGGLLETVWGIKQENSA